MFRFFPTPEIRLIAITQSFSSIGEIAVRLPLAFLILGLDHNPVSPEYVAEVFGSIFFAFMVPSVLFSGIYSWVINRFDRINIMVVADSIRICLVGTIAILAMTNNITVTIVYLLIFFDFTLCGLVDPTLHSIVPNLVGTNNLSLANAAIAFSEGVGYTVGPILGGFFTTYLTGSLELLLTCCFYAVSVICSFRLRRYLKPDCKTFLIEATRQPEYLSPPVNKCGVVKFGNLLEYLIEYKNVFLNYLAKIAGNKIFLAEIVTGVSIGGAAATIPTILNSDMGIGASGIGDVLTLSGLGSLVGGIILLASQYLRGLARMETIAIILLLSGILTIGLEWIQNLLFFGVILFLLSILFAVRRTFVRNYMQQTISTNILGSGLSIMNMSFCFGYLLGTLLFPKLIGIGGMFFAIIVVGVVRFVGAGILLWLRDQRVILEKI